MTKKRLECPEQIEEELAGLRKDFLLNDKCKTLVFVSMATDEMIHLVSMYPEVLFMDTTASERISFRTCDFLFTLLIKFSLISIHMSFYSSGTNRHKTELFVKAMKTPCGKTFPGNFSNIPSLKKWVFHAIFRLAFLELYGDEVCSMNCLALTDEEDAEYRSFESLIATNDIFKLSKVMLCIFHAIWQPFKCDIYTLCPKISKKGKPTQLSEVGSAWSEYCLILFVITL